MGAQDVIVSNDVSHSRHGLEQPLRDSIRELRLGHQSLAESLEQALVEGDATHAELAECRAELARTRRALEERSQELAERSRSEEGLAARGVELETRLSASQAELAQAAKTLAECQAKSASGEVQAALHREQIEQQRCDLQTARRRARGDRQPVD